MRTSCVKNGLVFGVILLFIGVAVQPVITAVDNDTDVNDISIDNSDEIEPLDDYKEIFTHIDGVCRNFTVKRRGIFIHRGVEMYAHGSWGITISGIRFPFNFFEEDVYYVKVPCLIGILIYKSTCHVNGFAFGNIEWS